MWLTSIQLRSGLIVTLAGFLLIGCGSDTLETVPVSGTVSLGDQPVSAGSVEFHPADASGDNAGYVPVGTIGEGGRYTISTRSKEGAPVGQYKVVVRVTAPVDQNDPYAVPQVVSPAQYNDPNKTDLSVEVVEDPAPGAYDLKLTK